MKMYSETGLQPRSLSALKEFERRRLLGAGSFGKVYLVKHTICGTKFAAKEQNTSKDSREEAKILSKLKNDEVS